MCVVAAIVRCLVCQTGCGLVCVAEPCYVCVYVCVRAHACMCMGVGCGCGVWVWGVGVCVHLHSNQYL